MIKPEELRIGNWVMGDNGPVQIEPNSFQNIFNGSYDQDPIPLTEEWLAKFGFEYREMNLGYVKEATEGNIYISKKFTFEFDGFNIGMQREIQYVHQLQNLYFALTGEELN